MDPANKATILANTYPFSADNQRLSQSDSERLTQLGLPATAYQDPEGKKQIYLLVGAKPKLSDLDKLLLSVKQAKFPTAHPASIDTFIKRSKH